MKKVTLYEDVHREVKVEAAKEETSVPHMASELIRWALGEKRERKCKLADLGKPARKSAAR